MRIWIQGYGMETEPTKAMIKSVRRIPILAILILSTFIILALFAEWVAPYSPTKINLTNRLLPPFWVENGSINHLLGTDRIGRDILSRVIFGARISLTAGLVAVCIAAFVGTVLGLISGYFGKITDSIIMRLTDAMLSLPIILIALLFAVTLGPSFTNLIIVLGIVMWARFARLVRGEVLTWKDREFVALARVVGASPLRIMVRHILPNVVNPLVILSTLQIGWVIIVESSLSFLGAGIPPPTPSWGAMMADGRSYIDSAIWLSLYPGVALVTVVLSVNMLGDWLRDYLDPKMRNLR